MLCAPDVEKNPAAGTELLRDYFGLRRLEWSDDDTVGFHLTHGETLALLRDCGFEVLELKEIQPPPGATTRYDFVTLDWARRWPSEELWRARKRPISR